MKNYSYAIFADMSCDMTSAIRTRFEVDGYLKGYISTPEAEDIEGSIDLSDAELDAFYASLKENINKYKTAPASIDEIVAYFETFLQQGKDILAISISSKLSATHNLMVCAQKIACEKYPERKIFIVDSLKYSLGIGLLTVKACELRSEGLSIEQNAEKLEAIKNTIHQITSFDDLFCLAAKGRISHVKAFFGTLAGIKTMGDFDAEGVPDMFARVSGYKMVFNLFIEYIKKTIKSANEQIIFIAHSARKKQAEMLASKIKEEIKPKEVIICNIQQYEGINVGPGVFVVFYFGTKEVDLKHGKEIVDEILSAKL